MIAEISWGVLGMVILFGAAWIVYKMPRSNKVASVFVVGPAVIFFSFIAKGGEGFVSLIWWSYVALLFFWWCWVDCF